MGTVHSRSRARRRLPSDRSRPTAASSCASGAGSSGPRGRSRSPRTPGRREGPWRVKTPHVADQKIHQDPNAFSEGSRSRTCPICCSNARTPPGRPSSLDPRGTHDGERRPRTREPAKTRDSRASPRHAGRHGGPSGCGGVLACGLVVVAVLSAGAGLLWSLPSVGERRRWSERCSPNTTEPPSGFHPHAAGEGRGGSGRSVFLLKLHHQYPFRGGRAAVATLQTSGDPGGSTITQQLAKQLYGPALA